MKDEENSVLRQIIAHERTQIELLGAVQNTLTGDFDDAATFLSSS